MSLKDYTIIGPLCYRGKPDCMDVRCTRMISPDPPHITPGCMGWHCSYCDEPCGSQGHNCDAAKAILGAAEQVAREEGRIP